MTEEEITIGLLTEMFHIILMANGKASFCWGLSAGCSPRAGPSPVRRLLPWPSGGEGIAASYTAALQPFPRGCPMRYSSSLKPRQRNELSGFFCALFFLMNTVWKAQKGQKLSFFFRREAARASTGARRNILGVVAQSRHFVTPHVQPERAETLQATSPAVMW